jgi:hypothetical protein
VPFDLLFYLRLTDWNAAELTCDQRNEGSRSGVRFTKSECWSFNSKEEGLARRNLRETYAVKQLPDRQIRAPIPWADSVRVDEGAICLTSKMVENPTQKLVCALKSKRGSKFVCLPTKSLLSPDKASPGACQQRLQNSGGACNIAI